MSESAPADFEDYASRFPSQVRQLLSQMRETIRDTVPDATETISYLMPAFRIGTRVVSFAAYEKHIGFYPGSATIAAFETELSGYKRAKGSVQFPLDKPLPLDLVRRMMKFRAERR